MTDLSKTANNEVAGLKTVTVFSTLGKNAQEFKSQATTWSGLQKELSELKISHSGMKAVVGETRLTMEHPDAKVPVSNFSLYLMPIKTKSGMADRKELFVTIKAIVSKNPAAKNHFIVDGKNMTQLSTPKLEELLASYSSAAHTVKVDVTPVKEEKKEGKKEVKAEVASGEVEQYVQDIKDEMEECGIDDDVMETIIGKVNDIISVLSKPVTVSAKAAPKAEPIKAETAEQKLAREQKERQDKLNAKMANEANDLMRGFNDVRR